jgi:hypothetical protein
MSANEDAVAISEHGPTDNIRLQFAQSRIALLSLLSHPLASPLALHKLSGPSPRPLLTNSLNPEQSHDQAHPQPNATRLQ